jgi:sorting nexin-1/2
VCDPVVKDGMSKYVLYTIKGTDKDGPFEAFRRYSDFFHLREILLQRWPGCYIPPIPPKKALV